MPKRKLFRKEEQASIQLAVVCLKHLGIKPTVAKTKDLAAVIRQYRAEEQKVN